MVRPGSANVPTERGLWSALRGFLPTQNATMPNAEAQIHLLCTSIALDDRADLP